MAWEKPYGMEFDPFDKLAVVDAGDCFFDHGKPDAVPDAIEAHASKIIEQGPALLTLGGDHFISYPLLKAHAKKHGAPLTLLHFDAHSDTWGDEDDRIDHGTMFYWAAKYGIVQGIGDTIGPGGVFYGLRHIPVILDICSDMEELCPEAWFLNYTNPMAMICWAVNDHSAVKNIGLCHSVQGTASELARYIGAPLDEVRYWVAGINHMAWFLEFMWRGEDAYTLLRERFKDPAVYSGPDAHWAGPDIVRVEVFKALGYFPTESSQHLSEYVPWFRKRPELMERFNLNNRLDTLKTMIESRARSEEEMRRLVASGDLIPVERSTEYCSSIIHSMETGTPRRVNVNVSNHGLITNLPQGSCVEVPCLVDGGGVHPCHVGDLPPQCAALNRTNINVQELAVLGAVEKDRELVFRSLLLDPLTSAMLTIDETRRMVDEMFRVEAHLLKGFV